MGIEKDESENRKKISQPKENAESGFQQPESEITDPRQFMEVMWEELTTPPTREQLEALFLRPEFGRKVVSAIIRTERVSRPISQQGGIGHEYGFVVYSSPEKNQFSISPVFPGETTRIDLDQPSWEYFKENETDEGIGEEENTDEVLGLRSVVIHTHVNVIVGRLGAIIKPSARVIDNDFFSSQDLRELRRIAEEEDTSLIFGVGIRNSKDTNRKLVLVSFGDVKKFIDFDPDAVFEESRKYKRKNSGVPVNIYEAAGLNVAVLRVDMNRHSVSPLDPEEVRHASDVLIRRSP